MKIPGSLGHLFWDYDPDDLDADRHSAFVLDRLMPHMEDGIISWLLGTYPAEMLLAHLADDGTRKMGPRALEWWCAHLGVEQALRDQWLAAARARVSTSGFVGS